MSAPDLLANAAFFERLPIGMTILDASLNILYINAWMRERLTTVETPRELHDLMSWGDAGWREFLRQIHASHLLPATVLEQDFFLPLGPPPGLEVNVSFHRLEGIHSDTTIMVVTDIAAVRASQLQLEDTLTQVTEISDTAIHQAVELRRVNAELEEHIAKRTQDLRRANMDALRMLAVACEAKDHDTGEHVLRVQNYAEMLARELGLPDNQAYEIGYSSILHDVGKVHIPDAILTKPGPLTEEERLIIQDHPLAGERILGSNPFFACARRIARSHHENWDGTGYPDGLSRYGIPLEARIVHVADVFDALTSQRAYKSALGAIEALRSIGEYTGKMYDPEVVAAFISIGARGLLPTAAATPAQTAAN